MGTLSVSILARSLGGDCCSAAFIGLEFSVRSLHEAVYGERSGVLRRKFFVELRHNLVSLCLKPSTSAVWDLTLSSPKLT